ncbi:Helix-turn-helix domain protein [compost metagenome]
MRNCIAIQRARLLATLKRGPVDAELALRELGICYLAQRILDLRRQGYVIVTELCEVKDTQGRMKIGGRYKLETAA